MSESSEVSINGTLRLCGVIFLAIACAITTMIGISFSHVGGWPLKVTLILTVAIVNAFLVAGYLMHLLTEKKMVFTVLFFTVCFFTGLLGLTLWAMQDFPVGTTN
jgi:hypothetical protein